MAGTVRDKLARAVGLDKEVRDDDLPSISNADIFIEREPTVHDFFVELVPSLRDVGLYIYNLFPFIHWIGKYNVHWFAGDLVAGSSPCAAPRRAASPPRCARRPG